MPATVTHRATEHVRRMTFDIVAEADGDVPTMTLSRFDGYLLALKTVPGSPPPTDHYDVVITDPSGHDLLQGVGANRSARVAQQAVIRYAGLDVHPDVNERDTLVLHLCGNAVSGATVAITLIYGGAAR